VDYVFVSIACAITGTMFILFLYIYLYSVYREAYMGAWIIGWLIHFTRISLFESGMLDWKHSGVYCLAYQIFFISCATVLLYSAHLVVSKPLNKKWLYSAAGALLLGVIFEFMDLSIFYKLLPVTWISSAMLVCIGDIYLNKFETKGVGNHITGYAFILWAFLTLFTNTEYPQSMTLLCGISRLIIASGILLVYFEKTRLDLVAGQIYYKGLADNSVDIIYHYDLLPENKVNYISPSVYLITGYTPDEFYSNPNLFESLIHPEDLWTFKTFISIPSLPMDIPLDYRLIHKDNSIIYIEQNFIPICDKENNLTGLQGILRDVTARNNIAQTEIMYDRLNTIGKTAVSIAHQIRNPLTTVRGYLQLHKNKCIHNDNYKLMIEEIDNANSIISEYLLLAQDKHVNFKKCILNTIICSVLPLIETYAVSSNIIIKTELEEVPELTLDEAEIRCMIINLLRNSMDAMPSGGELTLRTAVTKKEVILSISDQGNGIPENILDNLGTPFLTTKNTGIGLGLPISYRIATRNHADISVKSSQQGTTFFIHFNVPCFAK